MQEIFFQAFSKGRCLVLLDGLDEISGLARRQIVIESINSFVALYPLNKFLITSRPQSFKDISRLNDFVVYEFLPYQQQQVAAFISNNFPSKQASQFISMLESDQQIAELASSPLFLAMFSIIFNQYGVIPNTREEIIKSYIDAMIGHGERSKDISQENTISEDEILEILIEVAFYLSEKSKDVISRTELIKLIKNMNGRSTEFASSFVEFLSERSGLLREVGPDYYRFIHRLILEYFAKLKAKN
jgi:predicted NACHT family NTPase